MFKPGESIGLQLQSKTDQASPEELEQMIQKIKKVVEKYDYKVGSCGTWPSFQKMMAKSWLIPRIETFIDETK